MTVFITKEDLDKFEKDRIPFYYYDSVDQLKEYEGDVEWRELPKKVYDRMNGGDMTDFDSISMN